MALTRSELADFVFDHLPEGMPGLARASILLAINTMPQAQIEFIAGKLGEATEIVKRDGFEALRPWMVDLGVPAEYVDKVMTLYAQGEATH